MRPLTSPDRMTATIFANADADLRRDRFDGWGIVKTAIEIPECCGVVSCDSDTV